MGIFLLLSPATVAYFTLYYKWQSESLPVIPKPPSSPAYSFHKALTNAIRCVTPCISRIFPKCPFPLSGIVSVWPYMAIGPYVAKREGSSPWFTLHQKTLNNNMLDLFSADLSCWHGSWYGAAYIYHSLEPRTLILVPCPPCAF